MKIRKANMADVPEIESILLEAVDWLNAMGEPLWQTTDVLWEKMSQTHPIEEWYVVEDETLVATFLLCDEDQTYWSKCPKGESLFLHKLCVRRAYAKQGISQLILDYFKAEAKRLGMKDCRLDCRSAKTALKNFYESHGFQLVNEKEYVKGYMTSRYLFKIS